MFAHLSGPIGVGKIGVTVRDEVVERELPHPRVSRDPAHINGDCLGSAAPKKKTTVADRDGGELILAPAEGEEFSGDALPAGWDCPMCYAPRDAFDALRAAFERVPVNHRGQLLQAMAQTGTVTSLICTVVPQTSNPVVANLSSWQRPRRYSIAIAAGRLVPSPFQ